MSQPKREQEAWPAEIYLVSDEGVAWRVWRYSPSSSPNFESRPYLPASVSEGLVEALEEAIVLVPGWASYASPYFQEKHDLAGDVARLEKALADFKAIAGEGS